MRNKHNCVNCNWHVEDKIVDYNVISNYCCMKEPYIENPEEENNCQPFSPLKRGNINEK